MTVTAPYSSNSAAKQFVSDVMGAQHHGTETPAPSFNLGFSPITTNTYEQREAKGKDKLAEEDYQPKAIRREVKLGDLMRQVLLGISITTEERKVHDLCLATFGGPE
ncbi:hypothetical protein L6452_36129 [Arctium lappa]|uniref:Uncharacterized protein n=1 Tax=Arctium lappa TaxID=4217 RepID=A0ACB8YCJ4_ARCLA|nr:hypothetical protein L6452_36129 [Arctium lappa]